jgi:DDE superfamily endonuclease
LRPYLQVGYQGSNLTPDQVLFNMAMSKVRIAVEWAFRDLKMYFTHMDFARKLNMGVTPVDCGTSAPQYYGTSGSVSMEVRQPNTSTVILFRSKNT